jgi:5-(carboxyamino)imidazole ribonucleotide synthase
VSGAASFIAPGATLGVMGGGQLGRMFVHAAQRMGYFTAVLDPDPDSPAGRVAHHHLQADYLDPDALARLAALSAAVTTEFENVPAAALAALAERIPGGRVSPGAQSGAVCHDPAAAKAHLARCGVPGAPYALIDSADSLAKVDPALFPAILKTVRLGYDGKGQVAVADAHALASAWAELGGAVCVLEQRLDLAVELSVIVARSAAGETVHLPPQQNLHRRGILAVTLVPALAIAADVQAAAIASAYRLAASIDHVGVLCVEFFVLRDGTLVANEMAPRPHNSGHPSLDACDVSQFELQVRAMTGAPLTAPRLHSPCVMLNLLGDLWQRGAQPAEPDWAGVLGLPGVHLHLYGKREARPGRKMGHLSVTAASPDAALAVAGECAARLGIEAF